MKRLALLLLALTAAPAAAQQAPAAGANPMIGSVLPWYTGGKTYVVRAAEQMSDADYAFRPTPEVRTFGQIIGHITSLHNLACATALGETPNPEDVEKTRTTKPALLEALRASVTLCDRAFAQGDAAMLQQTKLFGQDHTRLSVLTLVAIHDFEHYGNLVTYMRLKGMVPPSSQPQGQ
jgi:uncharacterized damage-inducible protein DinB